MPIGRDPHNSDVNAVAPVRFACRACGQEHAKWAPRCSGCGATKGFDVVSTNAEVPAAVVQDRVPAPRMVPQELPVVPQHSRLTIVRAPSPEPELTDPVEELESEEISAEGPVPISEIAEATFVRDSTGLEPVDHVLGGGLVVASVVLLASPPGIGKSSLTLQVLVGLKHRCLYVTGEETREQLAATARRIDAVSPRLYVMAERNLTKIFAHARAMRAQTIAIDSIQKMICEDVGGRAGSPAQLKACTDRLVSYAKSTDTALWLIGHVTADGDIAGPKTIEHDVDVVLEMEQGPKLEGRERILRCPGKNRFGATNVVGRLELTDKGFVPIDGDGWNEVSL